ncbi:aminoacetone oxidase family FAD-binding enzyme [Candidatus Uhrbacteria bacterium CG_4_9_14_3_um_filter_36_7]|uniref:Aminoacetone oxidase family FAD-binding enzyme n=1 Tax=Candidatus Uhrbacteria bacterium CG_4_9_14_3_um_filter_36_7 TaxID=1975033 RepID=A0A2M7XH84_9BACT|nr:MAG: aminoacetone oxidase family FAD-binding enzyme [Candidatus Uhrbacteria bacterium CG_4_9_14_3_um_filter_36_7]
MRIGIIGAGASGMMAAARLLKTEKDLDIFLIERNEVIGKKVSMTGGGRCNVTTGLEDIRIILTKYPRGGKFLTHAMYQFSPVMVRDWFESHGVPLKKEKDNRIFPESNKSKDIIDVFEEVFKDPRIHIFLNTRVIRIEKQDGYFCLFFQGSNKCIQVEKLILATGGQAYRKAGSTGDGYTFATSLGHSLTPLAPSLTAFLTHEHWPTSISGLSFPNTLLKAGKNKHFLTQGPFLFTHKGISGPAVFALSSLTAFEIFDTKHPMEISIDLFPDFSIETLHYQLQEHIMINAKRSFANVLSILIPKALVEVCLCEINISFEKQAAQINKKEIKQVITWLKNIPLGVIGRCAGEEFVTAGGVELSEINPQTMESKICPGLYLTGEILNIDGFTGGFNLQAAWCTGYLAAEHIIKENK